MERYHRQLIIDEIGPSGQEKLNNAKVLIIGAGGLGSPAAYYLAGAGVGTIGIIDADVISESNLNRQILHAAKDIGRSKVESAREAILRLNDQIDVKTYPYLFTEENGQELVREYDFILDCVDTFESKFLINDVCVTEKKPFCHAGVIRFQGQVLTYVPGQGPCYRCIFEDVPEQGTAMEPSKVGIIGAIAGVIGSVQALEVIKYVLGIGELLTGRMYILDGLAMQTRIAKFPKATPGCICSRTDPESEAYCENKQ